MKKFKESSPGKSLLTLSLFLALCCMAPTKGNSFNNSINEAAPVPDIKANGQDGPINITTANKLSVTIDLNAGGNSSKADWWVVVKKPDGNWYYLHPLLNAFQQGLNPTFQGSLADISSYSVFNSSNLSVGTHTYYFGVDMTVDGSVTMGNVVYDSVVVNVGNTTTPTPTPGAPTNFSGTYTGPGTATCDQPGPGGSFIDTFILTHSGSTLTGTYFDDDGNTGTLSGTINSVTGSFTATLSGSNSYCTHTGSSSGTIIGNTLNSNFKVTINCSGSIITCTGSETLTKTQ